MLSPHSVSFAALMTLKLPGTCVLKPSGKFRGFEATLKLKRLIFQILICRIFCYRAKYGLDRVRNAVHCTDMPEDGVLEV